MVYAAILPGWHTISLVSRWEARIFCVRWDEDSRNGWPNSPRAKLRYLSMVLVYCRPLSLRSALLLSLLLSTSSASSFCYWRSSVAMTTDGTRFVSQHESLGPLNDRNIIYLPTKRSGFQLWQVDHRRWRVVHSDVIPEIFTESWPLECTTRGVKRKPNTTEKKRNVSPVREKLEMTPKILK